MVSLRIALLIATLSCTALVAVADDAEEFDIEIDDREEIEDPDLAWLIASKRVSPARCLAGEKVTVTLEVHNVGPSAAMQVVVSDNVSGLQLVSGDTSGQFDLIRAGGKVSMEYVFVARGAKSVILPPATIKYIPADDVKQQVSMSSPGKLYVQSGVEKVGDLALGAGRVVSLGTLRTPAAWFNVITLGAIAAGALLAYTTYTKLNQASAARRRQAAEESLMKDK